MTHLLQTLHVCVRAYRSFSLDCVQVSGGEAVGAAGSGDGDGDGEGV